MHFRITVISHLKLPLNGLMIGATVSKGKVVHCDLLANMMV